ncbi:MAG: hypothetical protein K2H46_01480 [Muribaculaceae bacterium]|nr:hypothetical protein [Muribaculaceae bacterium]
MGKILIQEISIISKVEILGHQFNGLLDIKKAVEKYCRIKRDSWDVEPKSPVEGIHVICVYEPYPCFDSYDYANEDRDYRNYFFSTEPFTKQQIDYLSKLPTSSNAQILNVLMPEWTLPAIYYPGEGEMMRVATLDEV